MSIFKRLLNVARSEINFRRKSDSDPKPSPGEQQEQAPPPHEEESPGAQAQAKAESDPVAQAYASLELSPGADLAAVEKAWKQQLRRYHPDLHATDRNKQELAHQVTQQLNQAYTLLKERLK